MDTNTAESKRQMTIDEITIFINIIDAKDENIDEIFNGIQKEDGGWVLKAIEKRFKGYKINADKKTMIMTLAMGEGVVGRCAKYVDDMVHWSKENMKDSIDFKTFNEKIYPFGFPNF